MQALKFHTFTFDFSAINFFLYYIAGSKFRGDCMALFCKRGKTMPPPPPPTGARPPWEILDPPLPLAITLHQKAKIPHLQ